MTVSGLVTGGDIIAQLRDKGAFAEILLPSNMLRPGTELFLDGTTVSDVENELNTNIRVVGVYGEDFVCAVLGMEGIEYE